MPLAQVSESLFLDMEGGQANRLLVTYQEEQHITGNGHVEWLELVDSSEGCYFDQSVGVPGVVSRVPGFRNVGSFPPPPVPSTLSSQGV